MLDPLTALGLAGNVVQFVEFLVQLLDKAHEVHKSAQGTSQENLDIETVAETIRALQTKLGIRDSSTRDEYQADDSLVRLCSSCDETAKELLDVLDKFKLQGKRSPWKSMRHTIKTVRGQTAVLSICERLKRFQEILELTILVDLREKLDLQMISRSDNFKNLEASTQNIVLAVLENRSVFTEAICEQTVVFRELQQEEAAAAALRHTDVKSTLRASVKDINQLQSHEHSITRQEIQRVAYRAADLRAHMDKSTDEIKALIKATNQAKGIKERVKLAEKTNAQYATLAAMDLVHASLMDVLAKNNPGYVGNSWKMTNDCRDENSNVRQRQNLSSHGPLMTPPWGLRKPIESADFASASSSDSLDSFASMSLSESRSTAPDTRSSHMFESVAATPENQSIHSPSPYSPFERHQISENTAYTDMNYRLPSPPIDWKPYPVERAINPGMNERSRPIFQPQYASMNDGHIYGRGYGLGYGPEYQSQYPGYGPQSLQAPPWPPSEGSTDVPDPERKKKLQAITELIERQKIEYDKLQRELEDKAAQAQKEIDERNAREAAERATMEAVAAKTVWEKKVELEKRQALLEFEEAQRKAMVDSKEAQKRAAEEKAAWETRIEEERKVSLAKGAEMAIRKLEAERKKEEERIAREKETEAELRSKHIMIPWPSIPSFLKRS